MTRVATDALFSAVFRPNGLRAEVQHKASALPCCRSSRFCQKLGILAEYNDLTPSWVMQARSLCNHCLREHV